MDPKKKRTLAAALDNFLPLPTAKEDSRLMSALLRLMIDSDKRIAHLEAQLSRVQDK